MTEFEGFPSKQTRKVCSFVDCRPVDLTTCGLHLLMQPLPDRTNKSILRVIEHLAVEGGSVTTMPSGLISQLAVRPVALTSNITL